MTWSLWAICVYSLMFWINLGPGERATLDCSWMDGADRKALVVLTTQGARSLTVDVASRRLYWISDFKHVRLGESMFYTSPKMFFGPYSFCC